MVDSKGMRKKIGRQIVIKRKLACLCILLSDKISSKAKGLYLR